MKKTFLRVITLFIIMLLCASPVFALTIDTGNTENTEDNKESSNSVVSGVTTMEVVERNICEINLTDPSTNEVVGKFTKQLTNFDASKKEATLTLTLENLMKEELITEPVEVFLVLDNSSSMSRTYNGSTKVDYVAETAALFTESLFEYFENAQVGIVSFTCADLVSSTSMDFNDGTQADAKLVLGLSNSKDTVKSKIIEYQNSERGQHTNIEAGLALAESNFTDSTETEKYIILISDGVPNLCLNTETTLQYSGVIASSTKSKLQDLNSKGYHIFSVLMGLNDADSENPNAPVNESTGKHMTYRELAEEIFGTVYNPTVGHFYYIDYDSLDTTVNGDIYNSMIKLKDNSLTNITIKDYFPQEIIDNFNFEYVKSPNIGSVSQKIDASDNSITWDIELLKAGEVATLSYKLTLKDDYDKAIVDKILPTNTNVDIGYTYNDTTGKVSSTVSPTVRVKYSESSKDETVAKTPIPQTGLYTTILFAIVVVAIVAFAIIRANQIKKLK